MATESGVPIEHVIIIFKENHTFDNYFGGFPGSDGVPMSATPDPAIDPPHDHETCLKALSGSGGIKEGYGRAEITAYWQYAEQYVLCDNYFTDVASQSEPNHLYAFAAHSPIVDNSAPSRTYQPQPPFNLMTLPQVLDSANLTWGHFSESTSSYFDHVTWLKSQKKINAPTSDFDTQAASGQLANVSWLYAPAGFSEHPGDRDASGTPAGPVPGMQWTVERVNAVAHGPLWGSSAIFITWDDWGGWFDHVVPKAQSTWLGGGPANVAMPYKGSQFRYGYRVPCLVISPWAKASFVNKSFNSHCSLVKFCLRLFAQKAWSVPALAANDPSGDLWESFAFDGAPNMNMPPGA